MSADTVIVEVARELRTSATGAATRVLDLFLEGYPRLQITQLRTVYLSCFSVARDDIEQWRKYANNGGGVCLGLRVLDEPSPTDSNVGSKLLEVDYSESSWRESVTTNFKAVCLLLAKVETLPNNLQLGLSALYRIAAFRAITAKQPAWKGEQEYRHVTIMHKETTLRPKQRLSENKIIRYLPMRVRVDGQRIAFAEIIIGPNQDSGPARKRLKQLLADAGYTADEMEYPSISLSAIPPWKPT